MLQGKAGRGKNHLPVGDAHLAIQGGSRAYCGTPAESIDTLSQVGGTGDSERLSQPTPSLACS